MSLKRVVRLANQEIMCLYKRTFGEILLTCQIVNDEYLVAMYETDNKITAVTITATTTTIRAKF